VNGGKENGKKVTVGPAWSRSGAGSYTKNENRAKGRLKPFPSLVRGKSDEKEVSDRRLSTVGATESGKIPLLSPV